MAARALADRRAVLQGKQRKGPSMTDDILLARHERAREYIDKIRNKAKREYAEAYYRGVIRNDSIGPDELEARFMAISPHPLSHMGAQAVRMQLARIMKGEDE
jgi:hypothetical protein